MLQIAFLLFAVIVTASGHHKRQDLPIPYSPTITLKNGSVIENPTAFATPFDLSVEDLWDLFVGPVTEAATTTTVEAEAVPAVSLIPPPPLFYSPWPTGAQAIMEVKNESWSFPKDFYWGVAGAAFQIEGAVKDEGRGPCIWDVLGHRVTDFTTNNYTADVANNNYYLYKQDIARIAALGVKAYSFSLSWSRIMPFGRGPVNQLAIDHYNDVIDTCLEYNIIPMVTLFHWDLPLYLQNTYGGWLSEQIVGDFVAYAKVAFGAFGDRVQHWYTVNEPVVFCGDYPLPAHYFKNFTMPYQQQRWYCGHSVLLAHSQAYHLGKSMMPNSTISFKNNGGHHIPLTNSSADAEAVQRAWDFQEGWFSDPIYLTGDYGTNIKAYVSTFLRNFTAQEQAAIKGSADTYAIDAYTAQLHMAPDTGLDACVNDSSNPLYPICANTSYTYSDADGGWAIGAYADVGASWLHKATDWLPTYLKYLAETWAGSRPVVISEFGFAEPYEALKTSLPDIRYDSIRSSYFQDFTRAVLIALSEGVNVAGCLAWSFYDNFEWSSGFAVKFGMQYVNFSDPELPRFYKASFFTYKHAFDVYQEK